MKKLILLTIILQFCIGVKAQPFSQEYGKILKEELELKSYPKDPNADAVIIYDKGLSYFVYDSNDGYEVVFERKLKIKIFKKSGFSWADIVIPIYEENYIYENLSDVEGTTYNLENGLITNSKLDIKSIFDEKIDKNWVNKKFAMPNIKEGSVIEISYKIRSPYLFNIQDWLFQHSIPAVYSEYIVKICPFYDYVYILQGVSKFDIYNTRNEAATSYPYRSRYDFTPEVVVYQFALKDIPSFTDESYITSRNDYIIKLDFQLSEFHKLDGSKEKIISTWPILIKNLLKNEDFGKYINQSAKTAKSIPELQKLETQSESKKIEELVNYVKKNYNWNGLKRLLTTNTLREFQKEKTGNSANINLYLNGLLNAFGIEAYPVILSTREHGKISIDYPFTHYFNYVVVMAKIDGKFILTDATDPLCPYNVIPTRCINEKGLVIKKDSEDWVLLTNNNISSTNERILLKIDEKSDTATCALYLNSSDYEAYNYRKTYNNDVEKLEDYYKQKGYIDIDSLSTQNFEDPLKPYQVSLKTKTLVERVDNKIYISPFLNEIMKTNPLKQQNRIYPVDFIYPQRYLVNSTILIPDNYKIEFLPAKQSIDNSLFKMEYQINKINEHTINVVGMYTTTKAVYTSNEYAKIRFFFNEMIAKFNEKIVLVK